MMSSIFRLSILSFIILYVKCDDLDYCYAEDENPFKLFSTWTPPAWLWVYVEKKDSDCKPIYIWSLLKHGAKSFTHEQIERSKTLVNVEMDINRHDIEHCALCMMDFNKIRSLNNLNLNKEHNDKLVKRAHLAQEMFASHLKSIMESSPGFSSSDKRQIQIQTSEATEAKRSAVNFAKKFLGNSEATVDDIILENKPLLKTKSSCANWNANYEEADAFFSSPIIESLRQEVSFRLGYSEEALSMDKILALYESCVFGYIFSSLVNPPACAAFTPTHLKLLEYYQDLKHYYEFGHGNKQSEKMGCPLVKDMLNRLHIASEGTFEKIQPDNITFNQWSGKRVYINFVDEENLMGMIIKMKLYQDEEAPKHDNYYLQKTNRKWRSSLLSPFDGSVHAVLYNCKNKEKTVAFYHNHDLVKFDACKNAPDGNCPLNVFLTEVKKNLKEDECDTDYCGSFPQKTPEKEENKNGSGGSMMSYSCVVMAVCFFFNRFLF